ncbi:MAG: DUF4293 family protein [Bacteroidetes bacterium]|nr:MAG: DUF4293 family protein [Bacteroidota bacterium]
MIQRIQSLYLLIISILSSLLIFFSFQYNIIEMSHIEHLRLNIISAQNKYLLIASVLNLVISVDALTILFLYKNRKLQMTLCHYLTGMNLILISLMYYGAKQINGIPVYQLPFIIPIINIILSQLARYYIKKDDDLIKSADRIR